MKILNHILPRLPNFPCATASNTFAFALQENAHFSISESLIAAIELMKCNMMSRQLEEEEEDSDKEIQELKQKIRIRRQQIRTKHMFSSCQEMGSDSG